MKKLLSLLSVLTISGTAVPTIIASSSYNKYKYEVDNNQDNKDEIIIKNLDRIKRYDRRECINKYAGKGATSGIAVTTSATYGLIGAGAGAGIGTSIFPGIGTLIGAFAGAASPLAFGAAVGGITGEVECPVEIEIKDVILNNNLGFIYYNDNNTIWNEIKKQNPNVNFDGLSISEKTDNSVKITVSESRSIYKDDSFVVVKYIFLNNLDDNIKLINEWKLNFHSWNEEILRQLKESYPQKTDNDKIDWLNNTREHLKDKIHSLNQDIVSLKNKIAVEELKGDFKVLEGRIERLENIVKDRANQCGVVTSSLEIARDIFTSIPKIENKIKNSGKLIKGLNAVASHISNATSAICFLISAFN